MENPPEKLSVELGTKGQRHANVSPALPPSRLDEKISPHVCLHCALPLDPRTAHKFCCKGCEFVHGLLQESKLTKFYELRGGSGHAISMPPSTPASYLWLGELSQKVAASSTLSRVNLDIQGLHCTGCVWLIEQLFRRKPGASQIVVNPMRGSLDLCVSNVFPLREWIGELENFGYRVGEALKKEDSKIDSLLLRTGVCFAFAANSMMFSIAIYLGLRSGSFFQIVNNINYGLATLSVIVGGSVFLSQPGKASSNAFCTLIFRLLWALRWPISVRRCLFY